MVLPCRSSYAWQKEGSRLAAVGGPEARDASLGGAPHQQLSHEQLAALLPHVIRGLNTSSMRRSQKGCCLRACLRTASVEA